MKYKFHVLKVEDEKKYLNPQQLTNLCEIYDAIITGRIRDEKKPGNDYIVINTDEPYAKEVISIMEKHKHWDENGPCGHSFIDVDEDFI